MKGMTGKSGGKQTTATGRPRGRPRKDDQQSRRRGPAKMANGRVNTGPQKRVRSNSRKQEGQARKRPRNATPNWPRNQQRGRKVFTHNFPKKGGKKFSSEENSRYEVIEKYVNGY